MQEVDCIYCHFHFVTFLKDLKLIFRNLLIRIVESGPWTRAFSPSDWLKLIPLGNLLKHITQQKHYYHFKETDRFLQYCIERLLCQYISLKYRAVCFCYPVLCFDASQETKNSPELCTILHNLERWKQMTEKPYGTWLCTHFFIAKNFNLRSLAHSQRGELWMVRQK